MKKIPNLLIVNLLCGAASQAAVTSYTSRSAFDGATTTGTQYNLPNQQVLTTTPIRFRALTPSEQGSELWIADVVNHTPGSLWGPTTGALDSFDPNYFTSGNIIPDTASGFSDFTGNEFRSIDLMHFVIDVKSGSTNALGWYAVESAGAASSGGFPFSKFEVTAYDGAMMLDTFDFIPASFNSGIPVGNVFFGITSTNPFTSLRFRELSNDPRTATPDSPLYQVGDANPEIFGNFVFATALVPETSTSVSLCASFVLIAARRKR